MTVCLAPNGANVFRENGPPKRILVATIRGVAIVERANTGAPWRVTGHALEDCHISSLARDTLRGGVFAGAHSGGLFFSEDDGWTWQRRTNGLTCEHVFCVYALEQNGGAVLYAGTEPVSLFCSADYGKSWRELPAIHQVPGMEKWTFPPPPHIAHAKALLFDRRDHATIYACIEQGALLKTINGGESWIELDSYFRADDVWYRDIHRLVAMPSCPDELFMTTGMGLYHSQDAGAHWEKLTDTQFQLGYPDHFIVSPSNEDILYMSGATHDPTEWRTSHLANGKVMKSRDRGRTWSLADKGLPQDKRPNIEAMSIASWPGGYSLLVGNTDGDVFISDDGAESWHRVVRGLAPVSKVGHFRHLQSESAA